MTGNGKQQCQKIRPKKCFAVLFKRIQNFGSFQLLFLRFLIVSTCHLFLIYKYYCAQAHLWAHFHYTLSYMISSSFMTLNSIQHASASKSPTVRTFIGISDLYIATYCWVIELYEIDDKNYMNFIVFRLPIKDSFIHLNRINIFIWMLYSYL